MKRFNHTLLAFALLLASLLAARADEPPFQEQLLEREDREVQMAATMRLVKDPNDQGVYAILVSLKNTSPDHEFLFTKNGGNRVKGQEDGTSYSIMIFQAGNYLSDNAFVIKCFPSPSPQTVKIPPLGTYDWLIPLNQQIKGEWPPDRVATGCRIFVNIPLAYRHQKLRALSFDQPRSNLTGETVTDHEGKSLSLHASDVTLTGKSLAGDAKAKFEKSQKGN